MKYGVKSVSMDDICKEVGISKKTIYTQIDNKAELIDLVVRDFMEKEKVIIEEIRIASIDAIDEMRKIANHVLYFLKMMKPSLVNDLKKYYKSSWLLIENIHMVFIQKVISENLLRGKKEGVYRDELNESIISILYLQASNCTVDEDVFPINTFSRVGLFSTFIEYHMHGILNSSGLKKYKNYKKQQ